MKKILRQTNTLVLICSLLLTTFSLSARISSFAPIVKSEQTKVVHIQVETQKDPRLERYLRELFPNMPLDREKSLRPSGSGFIISADGYIITNNHVVEDGKAFEVIMQDDSKYAAELIGQDPATDLALLKIDATGLPFVTFGDSDALEVGDWVLAIGNPLRLTHSVTAGIISAKGRDIFEGTAYGQFLQTDAAINQGNSGGPLFNAEGKVVGINTAIAASGQNIGFAIPINLAKNVIAQLREKGSVTRGYLGVQPQDISPELSASMGLPKDLVGVALVQVFPNTPAASAGLQTGDVITKVQGKTVKNRSDLIRIISETPPGEEVRISIYRKGRTINKRVAVGNRDEAFGSGGGITPLGLVLKEVTPDVAREFSLRVNRGLLIESLQNKSPATGKLRPGDVILAAAGEQVDTVQQLVDAIDRLSQGRESITLLVNRYGQQALLAIPLR